MKAIFKQYENILLILALVVFASILLASNAKNKQSPNIAEKLAMAVASPFQKMVTGVINSAVGTWQHYLYLVNTANLNDELTEKLEEEKMRNSLLLEELKKYRRVDDLLSFHPVARTRFQVADVIGWDSTNLSQTFVINKGSNAGLEQNMVVLTHEGLIGRVVTVGKNSSRVLMITDSRSAVDAYVQNTRDRCMVVGQNKRRTLIKYLPIDAEVKVGDKVVSSGLGGLFPKGIVIGTIETIEKDADRLFYRAELAPSANVIQVEEVLIMPEPSKVEPQEEAVK